jgi:hypothetical protein
MKGFLCAVVCVAAIYCGSIPPAQAITYNYSLNGTLAEDNGIGPSLVAYGGSFASGGGYIFGVQQGLSLSGTGIYDSYSIDIRFYLDDIYNGYSTYQKMSILGTSRLTWDCIVSAGILNVSPAVRTMAQHFQVVSWRLFG